MENGTISAGRACTPGGEGYLGKGVGGNRAFFYTGPLDPLINPLGERSVLEFPRE